MKTEIDLSQRAAVRPEHPNSWVFYDGRLARYHDVHIGVMTHALHYGTGCFEGIRAHWNEDRQQLFILQGPAHFERLRVNGRILSMDLPYTTQELMDVTIELLQRNRYRADVYIRPLLFKSAERIGVQLHDLPESFLIYTAPLGNYVGIGGIRCGVSSWRRIPDTALPARSKATANYLNSALAKTEAIVHGYDEAIVLTMDGHVSEGSAENVFLFRDGVFVTPPVTDDILEGVTRRLVIQLIKEELKLPVVERSVDRTELYVSEELFLCGTAAQVSPVVEVDGRKIADGKVGELSQELQQLYFKAVRGDNPKYASWSFAISPG
jgi:branched-chain amino acid aminotransferase